MPVSIPRNRPWSVRHAGLVLENAPGPAIPALRPVENSWAQADFPVLIWLDERIGELAPINVQCALSGSGIHDRGTPGISYV